jgi:hypothetical protein
VTTSPALPLSAKSRDRADSFPGFDIAHSRRVAATARDLHAPHANAPSPFCSNFCDDGDGQFPDDILEDDDADADSQSSDSEHEYPQFKLLARVPDVKPAARDDVCRSAILLLHLRVMVRPPLAVAQLRMPVLCVRVPQRHTLQSALGCRANRMWSRMVEFMSLQSIAVTLSHVRVGYRLSDVLMLCRVAIDIPVFAITCVRTGAAAGGRRAGQSSCSTWHTALLLAHAAFADVQPAAGPHPERSAPP